MHQPIEEIRRCRIGSDRGGGGGGGGCPGGSAHLVSFLPCKRRSVSKTCRKRHASRPSPWQTCGKAGPFHPGLNFASRRRSAATVRRAATGGEDQEL